MKKFLLFALSFWATLTIAANLEVDTVTATSFVGDGSGLTSVPSFTNLFEGSNRRLWTLGNTVTVHGTGGNISLGGTNNEVTRNLGASIGGIGGDNSGIASVNLAGNAVINHGDYNIASGYITTVVDGYDYGAHFGYYSYAESAYSLNHGHSGGGYQDNATRYHGYAYDGSPFQQPNRYPNAQYIETGKSTKTTDATETEIIGVRVGVRRSVTEDYSDLAAFSVHDYRFQVTAYSTGSTSRAVASWDGVAIVMTDGVTGGVPDAYEITNSITKVAENLEGTNWTLAVSTTNGVMSIKGTGQASMGIIWQATVFGNENGGYLKSAFPK